MKPKIYLPFWKATTSDEVTAINKAQIGAFVEAYWAHSDYGLDVRDSISPAFIDRLAEDTTNAKQELRDILRRSEYWREDLQALKIPMIHERTTDYDRIYRCLMNIWENRDAWYNLDYDTRDKLRDILKFVASADETPDEYAAYALEQIVPHVYHTGQRKTKLFTKISLKLGLGDPNQGSSYQNEMWRTACAEFKSEPLCYLLYLSINPAHFLSMSNPYADNRGNALTSCHSFNQGAYKGGCIGYARDTVTMIAFTSANGGEGVFNRKTSRQCFLYHQGALIQSRLYTSRNSGSYGGVNAGNANEYWEYKDFRLAVQTQIAQGEAEPNQWITCPYRTKRGALNKYGVLADAHVAFGGYPDWEVFAKHKELIKLSILKSAKNRLEDFTVGEASLSLRTGEELVAQMDISA